ncbi:MAG: hypothetical protein NTZ30_12735, partial [Planctomycetota bacterium]|nr:hypothetical protein [Planctomycetota bacterium]
FASLLPRPQGFLDPISFVLSKGQDKDQEANNYAKSSEKSGKGEGDPGEKEGDKGSPKDGNQKAGKSAEDKESKGASKDSGKGLPRMGLRNQIKLKIMRVKVILEKMMVIRNRALLRIKALLPRHPLLLIFLALIK